MIDNAPGETGGVGLPFEFRQRDKSKDIQKKAFSHFSPSKIQTFDQIKPKRRIPYEKIEKLEKRWEKNRKELANSILTSYSSKLQKVMKTLPMDKLSPPYNGNATSARTKPKRQSVDVREKTFFKGATSFVLQAQASILI